MSDDPFQHHPELRDEITVPEQSFFRDFSVAKLKAVLEERGLPTGWWHSDDYREANRHETLARRQDRDLWVFGYGSLMWDPAFHFAEVRRAHVPGYARRFILKDVYGARGTFDAPGAMAALDKGPGCNGLAFRIAKDAIEEETAIIWRREYVTAAYIPTFVETDLGDMMVEALTFVADHDADLIEADLPRELQVRYLATGTGFMGSSADYLRNIVSHFRRLDIRDPETDALLEDVERYEAAGNTG